MPGAPDPAVGSPGDFLPPLREVIRRHGLAAKKSLGQHFLLDLNLTARIARVAGPLAGVHVVEVGPGPGGLTRALLATEAAQVVAIERDPRCLAALAEIAAVYPGRLVVVEGDALALDERTLAPPPRRIVANLPYNIAAPLLVGWLKRIDDFERIVVMVQKEMADRLVARPGGKDYGRLSVATQWAAVARIEFNVDRLAFVPPPKVTSSVVSLTPRTVREPARWDALETVTRFAFGQRRKMLRQSLKPLGLDLVALGLAPTARAEDLSVAEFCRLAECLAARDDPA